MRPLVVGVDGSDTGYEALDWAVDEAALHGLPLRLVYASRWKHYEGSQLAVSLGRPDEQVLADNIIGAGVERAALRNAAVAVTAEVLADEPETALESESARAFAVVVGSRGRGAFAGLLLGSVGLGVAARARCPAIIVRGDPAGLAGRHERVLVGVGESAQGAKALRFAFREAKARGCTLDAVRAWRCPAYETTDHPLLAGDPERYHVDRAAVLLDEALTEPGEEWPSVRVRRATVEGPAHKVLVQRSAAADLLVVGARRRDGGWGLQLGRAAHAAVHHAECPVAVVPETG